MKTPRTWRDIANGSGGDRAADLASKALREGRWLTSVGEPSSLDHLVERVARWSDAVGRPDPDVYTDGTLDAASLPLLAFVDDHPELYSTPNTRAHATLDAVDFTSAIPAASNIDDNVFLGDYFTSYVRFLFLEIYVGDVATPAPCTYFRDQLGWFVDGFLPCGWAGEWPHGRMRVF
jgi:hypothetical protein